MTTTSRIATSLSAALLVLGVAAGAAHAQDKMGKDHMKKDGMMEKDGMKKDGMTKDGMKK